MSKPQILVSLLLSATMMFATACGAKKAPAPEDQKAAPTPKEQLEGKARNTALLLVDPLTGAPYPAEEGLFDETQTETRVETYQTIPASSKTVARYDNVPNPDYENCKGCGAKKTTSKQVGYNVITTPEITNVSNVVVTTVTNRIMQRAGHYMTGYMTEEQGITAPQGIAFGPATSTGNLYRFAPTHVVSGQSSLSVWGGAIGDIGGVVTNALGSVANVLAAFNVPQGDNIVVSSGSIASSASELWFQQWIKNGGGGRRPGGCDYGNCDQPSKGSKKKFHKNNNSGPRR